MNKTELIAAVADKCSMKKKDAELASTATFEAIAEELVKGGKVQLIGFGTFETKNTEEKAGRNPKTGEAITIPAGKKVTFKASKNLKGNVG